MVLILSFSFHCVIKTKSVQRGLSQYKRLYACDVLQEWKERYGNLREDYTARNRSSHEMKETSYSDAVPPSNNRREFLCQRIYKQHLRGTEKHPTTHSAGVCRGKVFAVGGALREGLRRAPAGRWTPGLQRWFCLRQPAGHRVWKVSTNPQCPGVTV